MHELSDTRAATTASTLAHALPADLDVGISLSIIIPVYGNEGSIPRLLERLTLMDDTLAGGLEAVFVIDGSPDNSLQVLRRLLPMQTFRSQLIAHSRNFGAFAAVRTGLSQVRGATFSMMAADLQEPPQLVLDMHRLIASDEADVVVGVRTARADSDRGVFASRAYWALYRRFVQPELPSGGIDIFAGNRRVLANLVALDESNSSLVGLLYWLGFRRATVEYDRLDREEGRSGWTLKKKLRYFSDSIFSFTDLPIRLLMAIGCLGLAASLLVGIIVAAARISGFITVPGYAATILTISFFAALNLFGLGIVGSYVWRTFENTKRRPLTIVSAQYRFDGEGEDHA